MFPTYGYEFYFWWGLFGAILAATYALQDSAEDDIDLGPFEGLDDFDRDSYLGVQIGSDGADVLTASGDVASAMAGLDGADALTGSRAGDYILGGAGADSIDGLVGIDIIRAGGGDDQVNGGLGSDRIWGDTGDDILAGGSDNDTLDGGAGDDRLIGGRGPDILVGGAGNDTLSGLEADHAAARTATEADQDGPDTLDGGDGDDQIWMGAGDLATGGAGSDEFLADHRGDHDDGVRTITDFNRDEDSLALYLDPPAAGDPPHEITQSVSDDGADRLVQVNGVEILRIVGAGGDDPVDIETPPPPEDG